MNPGSLGLNLWPRYQFPLTYGWKQKPGNYVRTTTVDLLEIGNKHNYISADILLHGSRDQWLIPARWVHSPQQPHMSNTTGPLQIFSFIFSKRVFSMSPSMAEGGSDDELESVPLRLYLPVYVWFRRLITISWATQAFIGCTRSIELVSRGERWATETLWGSEGHTREGVWGETEDYYHGRFRRGLATKPGRWARTRGLQCR